MDEAKEYFFTVYRRNGKYEWEMSIKAGPFIDHEKIVLCKGPQPFNTKEEAIEGFSAFCIIINAKLGQVFKK